MKLHTRCCKNLWSYTLDAVKIYEVTHYTVRVYEVTH